MHQTRFSLGLLVVGLAFGSVLPSGLPIQAATVNVAPRGTAFSNRPLYANWSISMINDGDNVGINPLGVAHADTQPGAGLAYTLDLGKAYTISSIKIYPRQDGCCPERLSNFRVSVHDDNGQGALGAEVWGIDLFTDGSNPGSGQGMVVEISTPSSLAGRWVQIAALDANPPNYALQMTEVEVYADVPITEYNLALHAPASANRPLFNGYTPATLTDGNFTGAGNRLVHGDVSTEAGFAYEINLGAAIKLNQIVIWARQDGNNPERLSNYRVSVHPDNQGQPGTAVWQADLHTDGSYPDATPGSKDELTASLNPAGTFTGQWIRIESLDNPVPDYALQMTEVEVYGAPQGQPALLIVRQPSDIVAGLGASATLNAGVFVGGGIPDLVTYQWQLNGANLTGATNASYVTPLLGGDDEGGKYRCVVSYPGLTSQTTAEATLSINVAYRTTTASNRKTWGSFVVTSLVDGNPGTLVHLDTEPATGAAYTINLGTEYTLRKIVIWARQDACCPERLSNFRVSVHKDNNGAIGASVWQKDLFTDGTNAGNGSGAKVEITADPGTASQFKGQWIQITSLEDPVQNYALQIGEVEAFGAPAGGAELLITQQPQDAAIAPGTAATFTVAATVPGGSPAKIRYQWQVDTRDIANATNATYRTPVLQLGDEGKKYRCALNYPGLPSQTTVEVTTRFNVALNAAVESNRPMWGGLQIQHLVDGNRGTFVHLDVVPETGAAYTINFGASVKLSEIDIWPRQDGCCPERFANVRVSLHKDNNGQIGDSVWQTDLYTDGTNPGSSAGTVVKLTAANNPTGQFEGQWLQILSLEDPIQDYALQLSEVEAFPLSIAIVTPILTAERAGNQVILSWPTGATGFVLQQNADLSKPAGWTDTPGGANSPVTVTITGGAQFYRLRKP